MPTVLYVAAMVIAITLWLVTRSGPWLASTLVLGKVTAIPSRRGTGRPPALDYRCEGSHHLDTIPVFSKPPMPDTNLASSIG